MPKFVEVNVTSEESDDEVQYVPYVKPSPPVVDLLDSSGGEEISADTSILQQCEEKKKKKKKKKKSQSIKQGSVNGITTANDCENNNFAASGSDVASLESHINVDENIESISVSDHDELAVNGMDRERDGSNVELSVNVTPGSISNDAVPSTLSVSDDNIIPSEEPLPAIRIASSIFESNSGTHIPHQPGHDQVITGVSNTPTVNDLPKGKKSRSSTGIEKPIAAECSKNVSQSKSKATPSPKPRAKRQTVSEKTNLEIVNFLTTLGIELLPQDLSAPRRVRKPRKKSDNGMDSDQQSLPKVPNAPEEGLTSDIRIPPIITSKLPTEPSADSSPATATATALPIPHLETSARTVNSPAQPSTINTSSFVAVTQEITETPRSLKKIPRKRLTKKMNETSAANLSMEDVEDATFTRKELEEINLNLTTNLVFDTGDKRVRVRLDDNFGPSSITEPHIRTPKTHSSSFADPENVESTNFMEVDSDQDAQNNPSSFQNKPSTSRSQPDVSSALPSRLSTTTTDQDTANVATRIKESRTYYGSLDQGRNESWPQEEGIDSIRGCEQNEDGVGRGTSSHNSVDVTQDVSSLRDSTNVLSAHPSTCNMIVPYLPTSWNPEMSEFYDTIKDPNLRLGDVLETLSDDARLWSVPFFPPKPKVNKRMRCDNCKQWGHLTRTCPEKRKLPLCRFCGKTGHTGDTKGRRMCPSTMCLSCGKRRHSFTSGCDSCIYRRNPPRCSVCHIEGHDSSSCPDNWRRFHSITSMEQNIAKDGEEEQFVGDRAIYRPNRDLYCSNCASKGHGYYDCRTSHKMSSYHRQKFRIIKEFPAVPMNKEPTNSNIQATTATERTVVSTVVDAKDNNGKDVSVESFEVNLVNDSNSTEQAKKEWNCLSYPDCKNKPSLGNSCQTMYFTVAEHRLLLQAQETNKIISIQKVHNVQITVLQDRPKVHLWGHSHVAAKDDISKLVFKLKRVADRNQSKIQNAVKPKSPILVGSGSSSTEVKDSFKNINDADKREKELTISSSNPQSVGVSETLVNKEEQTVRMQLTSLLAIIPTEVTSTSAPQSSPEIITIDDDEDSTPLDTGNKEEVLTASLLPSEWDLLFPESLKLDGIISRISRQFSVNVYVSKEELSAFIQDGTLMNRRLAKGNIVNWLECQAGNVEFKMRLKLEDDGVQDVKVSKKRPRFDPKPKFNTAKRQRIDVSPSGVDNDESRELQPSVSPRHDQNTRRSGDRFGDRNKSTSPRGHKGKNNRGPGQSERERGRNQNKNQFNRNNNLNFNNRGPNYNDYMQNCQIPPPENGFAYGISFSNSNNNGYHRPSNAQGGFYRQNYPNNHQPQPQSQDRDQNRANERTGNRGNGRLRYYNAFM